MQYLLLIYDDEAKWASMSDAESAPYMRECEEVAQSIKKTGHYIVAEALQPTSTATTVRVQGGKTLATDGPYAETREQLGGFYLVEAKNLDEAIAIAAKIPAARSGSIEVRPVQKFG